MQPGQEIPSPVDEAMRKIRSMLPGTSHGTLNQIEMTLDKAVADWEKWLLFRIEDVKRALKCSPSVDIHDLPAIANRAGIAARKAEQVCEELKQVKTNGKRMLDMIGDRGRCKSCGAEIWWLKSKTGKAMPFTEALVSHFSDCPHANMHRKG